MAEDVHEKIAAQIRLIAAANLNLIALLEKSCPGPHNYVQHRDRKPPWCEACGYTGAGFRVRVVGTRAVRAAADHPHTDPGDGRTECDVCGKWVWLVTHSCKGVPVTEAARQRAAQRGGGAGA